MIENDFFWINDLIISITFYTHFLIIIINDFSFNTQYIYKASCTRVIEFLRNFEFRNWHAMRGGLMLPDSISEEKLEID